MNKVIICKGLPGSGKTRWAKEFLKGNPSFIRANRDEIRLMLGRSFSHRFEDVVTKVEHSAILAALEKGYDVIVDDTNLNPVTVKKIEDLVLGKAEIEIKSFLDVSPEECIKNDSEREGKSKVGPDVIWGMYNKYLKTNDNITTD